MKPICIILAILLTVTITIGQPPNVDSLKKQLFSSSSATVKLKALEMLAHYYQNYKTDSGLHYALQMVNLSQSLNNKFYESAAFSEVGNAFFHLGNYPKALEVELQSLKIAEQLKEGKQERMGFAYLQIGLIDRANGRYANAITNFQKSLRLRGTLDTDTYGIFSQIGSAWLELGNLDSALSYAQKGYLGYLQSPNKIRGPLVLNVMGNVSVRMGKLTLAKSYYHSAIVKAEELQFSYGEARGYLDLAMLFKEEGKIDSCIFYSQKSLQLSRNYNYALYTVNGYDFLTQMYELKKEPDSTLKYLKLMVAQKDSIFSQGKVQQYQLLLFDEDQRQHQLKEAEVAYQNKVRTYALLAIIFVALLIALILYRNNQQKQQANAALQQHEAITKKALDELTKTQTQLVQQEKMASLGELTAGIAHEIQNPLNFVNNFSDVNGELIGELKAERLKAIGERDEELENELLNDLLQNLQKISHHGKRADAIVKGMLEHSRISKGEKQLTDINALVDEYLRLSYHGLRAKDKDFNANFTTNFDESVGRIEVVPQDIGRVLLNLYNNAFYAASLPSKGGLNDAPTVWVSTRKEDNKVVIRVKDNGPGIPPKIVDKIFQPFFTTKPTGQGTGLGLSLSYDIIKAHGGELRLETNEGEFAEFTILLPGS